MKILSITFREDVSEIGVLQPPTFFTIIFSSVESSCIIFHKIPGTLRYAFSAIALVLSPLPAAKARAYPPGGKISSNIYIYICMFEK